MRPITLDEHTIQCALLREFAFEKPKNKRNWKVYQFLVDNSENKKKKVGEIEIYKDIYPLFLENKLNYEVESPGIKAIRRIIKFKRTNLLQQPEIEIIKKYVMIQLFRTPFFRNIFKTFLENKFKSTISKNEIEIQIQSLFIERILNEIHNSELKNFNLGIIVNRTSVPFIISDCPVKIFNYNAEKPKYCELNYDSIPNLSSPRILHPKIIFLDRTVLAMPINPYYLLILFKKHEYNPEIGKNIEFIKSINYDIFRQSRNYVFSKFFIKPRFFTNDEYPKRVKNIHDFRNKRTNYIKKIQPTKIMDGRNENDYFLTKYNEFLESLNAQEKYDLSNFIKKHQEANVYPGSIISFMGKEFIIKLKEFYSTQISDEEVVPIFLNLIKIKRIQF